MSETVFDFIQSVLLLEHPEGLDEAQRAERHLFTMRFQQLTAPVMAKGVEDTAFYRYYPLASLNEVGGDPEHFGVSLNKFHRRNLIRRELWPHGMISTATHDTKRGEDVRARINVLSEMPGEWDRAIRRWREMNRKLKTKRENGISPSSNEEYLFYQTLVGTWPLTPMNMEQHGTYVARIQAYMEKAAREAKMHTSWINPNGEHEKAIHDFVANALGASPDNSFLEDFRQFQASIANCGMWNSLSQLVLKIASPGMPDFYQGNELWCLDLVDPDNRHQVDYEVRRSMLEKLRMKDDGGQAALLGRLVAGPCDGAVKMYITSRALRFRKEHAELFGHGSYTSLVATGSRSRNVIAFARGQESKNVIVVVGRFFLRMCNSHRSPVGDIWGNTCVVLPKKIDHTRFQDVFTGQTIDAENRDGKMCLPLTTAFSHCSVALLVSRDESQA
jgi:(1->4)-alpha-D-glucan 1-alpha-D-glucosylmutase